MRNLGSTNNETLTILLVFEENSDKNDVQSTCEIFEPIKFSNPIEAIGRSKFNLFVDVLVSTYKNNLMWSKMLYCCLDIKHADNISEYALNARLRDDNFKTGFIVNKKMLNDLEKQYRKLKKIFSISGIIYDIISHEEKLIAKANKDLSLTIKIINENNLENALTEISVHTSRIENDLLQILNAHKF